MTTILTEIGWEDASGNPLGTWTNQADLVDEGDEITLAEGVTANSLAGNDIITGTNTATGNPFSIDNSGIINTSGGKDTITGIGGSRGIFNAGTIETGEGKDVIFANSNSYGIYNAGLYDERDGIISTGAGNDSITGGTGDTNFSGINNAGIIDTGDGNDTITGAGDSYGIYNTDTIKTGAGKDTITGSGGLSDGFFGIFNGGGSIDTGAGKDTITGIGTSTGIAYGAIDTGDGNDTIKGTSTFDSIYNQGGIVNVNINMGAGSDTIIGQNNSTSSAPGISNEGTVIDMGAGKDTVDALTGGFGGSGSVDLGEGQDLIRGFGQQIVDGGRGFDTAELGIDFDENQITFGSTAPTSIDITFDSATMSFTDVEVFDFNGQEFALEQLQDMV